MKKEQFNELLGVIKDNKNYSKLILDLDDTKVKFLIKHKEQAKIILPFYNRVNNEYISIYLSKIMNLDLPDYLLVAYITLFSAEELEYQRINHVLEKTLSLNSKEICELIQLATDTDLIESKFYKFAIDNVKLDSIHCNIAKDTDILRMPNYKDIILKLNDIEDEEWLDIFCNSFITFLSSNNNDYNKFIINIVMELTDIEASYLKEYVRLFTSKYFYLLPNYKEVIDYLLLPNIDINLLYLNGLVDILSDPLLIDNPQKYNYAFELTKKIKNVDDLDRFKSLAIRDKYILVSNYHLILDNVINIDADKYEIYVMFVNKIVTKSNETANAMLSFVKNYDGPVELLHEVYNSIDDLISSPYLNDILEKLKTFKKAEDIHVYLNMCTIAYATDNEKLQEKYNNKLYYDVDNKLSGLINNITSIVIYNYCFEDERKSVLNTIDKCLNLDNVEVGIEILSKLESELKKILSLPLEPTEDSKIEDIYDNVMSELELLNAISKATTIDEMKNIVDRLNDDEEINSHTFLKVKQKTVE